MSSYVEESLVQDERILYRGSLSIWAYALTIVTGIIFIPILIGLLILIHVWIQFRTTELAVTNKRVIAKFGFIRRSTFELNIERVEGIQVHQSILGRIFGFGTLRIAGAGNFDPIPNVSDPIRFKKTVMESQDAFRRLYGRSSY